MLRKEKRSFKQLQEKEQEAVYKVPAFTVGTYVFTSDKVILPEGVTFCNPLYMCDLDFANWGNCSVRFKFRFRF